MKEVTVQELKALKDAHADFQLIDVREPFERALCAIRGSTHIPLQQIPERASTLRKGSHLLIYCHHGGRSMRAVQFLMKQGYTNCKNLAGGIDDWSAQIDPDVPRY